MKSTISKTLICTSLLMVLATGCGKNGGGSSSSAPAPVAPVVNTLAPGVISEGMVALNNLNAWYNSTVEAHRFSEGYVRTVVRETISYDKCILWGSACAGVLKPITSQVTPTAQGAVKSSNVKLAKVFDTSSKTLIQIREMSDSRGDKIYDLTYTDNASRRQINYKIHTGINSAFNPVVINDQASKVEEKLISITDIAGEIFSMN